jgi:methyl-accepting chemotaxis protein
MDASAAQASDGARLVSNTAQSFAEVLLAAEDAARRAERITAVAQQLHRKSEGVVAAMDLVSSVVEENTAAAEQMAASTREVTDSMENIASVTEENSAAAQEVTAATLELTVQSEDVVASARDLSAMAEQMHAAASQFQIERAAEDRDRDQRGKRPQFASAPRRMHTPGFVPARAGQGAEGHAVAHLTPAPNERNGLHKAADHGPPRRSR